MKPLLFFFFLLLVYDLSAQQADYISVRKNGRAVKHFISGSRIVLQTTAGNYVEGPVHAIQHDSVYITIYDVRMLPTVWGTRIRDTVSVYVLPLHYKQIERIYLNPRRGFLKRSAGPLMMLGGGGYLVLNVLNGAVFGLPVTDAKNLRTIGTSAGVFGAGFLLNKMFQSDGFTTRKHEIRYVALGAGRPVL